MEKILCKGDEIIEGLVYLKNDEAVCDSLQVAEKFGKRHDRVLRAIEQIKNDSSPQKWGQSFKEKSYKDSSGKFNKMYEMNRDGFSILAMGFTGKKALEWKWKYIEAFNEMESIVRERSTLAWEESRREGKLTRRAETDTIQRLVEYAKGQGSTHSDKLYMTYSKLANKMAGISNREEATITQINNLSLLEHVILCVINDGIMEGKNYKNIYQDCKKRLQVVSALAYLG